MALIWLLVSMALTTVIIYSGYRLHKIWRARRGRLALAGLELLPTSMRYHEYRQLPTRSSTPPYFRKPYHSPSLSSNESPSPPLLSPPCPSSPSFRTEPSLQSRHQRSLSEPFSREGLPSAWSQEILHPVFSSASGALKPGTHGRHFSQPLNSPFSSPPSTPVSSRSVDVVSAANSFPQLSIGLPIVDDHALIHFSPSIESLHLDNDNHVRDVEDAVITSFDHEMLHLTKSPSMKAESASPCAIDLVIERDVESCSIIVLDVETGAPSQIGFASPSAPWNGDHLDSVESVIQAAEFVSSKDDVQLLEQASAMKEQARVDLECPGVSPKSDNILPEIPSTVAIQDRDVESPPIVFLKGDNILPEVPLTIASQDRDVEPPLIFFSNAKTDMSTTGDVTHPELPSVRKEDRDLDSPEVVPTTESAESSNSSRNDVLPVQSSSIQVQDVDLSESIPMIFHNADRGTFATEDVLTTLAEVSLTVAEMKDGAGSPVIATSEEVTQLWDRSDLYEPSKQTSALDVEGSRLDTWQEDSEDLLPPSEGISLILQDPWNLCHEDAASSSSQSGIAEDSLPSSSPVRQNIQAPYTGLVMQPHEEVVASENSDDNHGNSDDINDGDEKRDALAIQYDKPPSDLSLPTNENDSENATCSNSQSGPLPESSAGSAIRPAWSLRAADAPPFGIPTQSKESRDGGENSAISPPVVKRVPSLPGAFPESPGVSTAVETTRSNNSGSSASRRRIIRSPIDIVLAMQLRPGLGLGADPAWMVRLMFGWFIVLLSGTGGYDGYRLFH